MMEIVMKTLSRKKYERSASLATSRRILAPFFVAIGLIAATGCGETGNPELIESENANQQPPQTEGIENYCSQKGGQLVDNGQLCLESIDPIAGFGFGLVMGGSRPIRPGYVEQSYNQPYLLNFDLLPLDKVSVEATGYWSWLGFTKIDLEGKKTNGAQVTGEGLPAGLFATDQKNAFYVGFNGEFVASAAGKLGFGINVPGYESAQWGWVFENHTTTVTLKKISVMRCSDAAGTPFVCP